MINIDFLTLRAFFIENIDFFIGARLQKIQQPTRREFVLSLRNNAESRKFYININPQIYHVAFMENDRRPIEFPKHPPMFCMLLRKYLEGCRISDALVVENERILEFHFETYDELSEKRSLCLCIELMGKHSNVILYDRESSVIIGCAHNVGAEKSRYRELQGGLKYIYPPKNTGLSNELKEQFKNLSQEKIDEYLNSESFRPAISGNRYTLFEELLENSVPQKSVNAMLDEYYSNHQEQMALKSEKDKLIAVVSTKLKKVNSSIDKISTLLKKRDNTDKYKLYGELLTANLYQKKDYQDKIEVFDYIHGENIIIELDNTKTLNENAQRYFKLYTKSKTTKEKSTEILDGLTIEKEYLENIIYSINSAEKLNDLAEIKSELGIEEKTNKKETPSIMKLDIKGFEVYIGRNNKQNDYIISKLSKDEDYWFHTRLCAGSHVLLKVREKEPDEEVLFECCKLAREYSSANQPSKVGVVFTKRKFIKKPPAAPLGYVIYRNEKEVLV
ncbi:MAG: NFACT family protein [Candidatus Gastranaerophilales bacterium]|nr:NFACT family protein [Candidatus Gastranaerophilales bacterium]MCM1072658.1 NFACT family protein [Bacteroides sp.]